MALSAANFRDLGRGALGAPIGVEQNLRGSFTAQRDRHLQSLFDEVGTHVLLDGPADHPP